LKEKPSHLHIGFSPIPRGLVRRLYDHCDTILIIEEGYPYIERKLNGSIPRKARAGQAHGGRAPSAS